MHERLSLARYADKEIVTADFTGYKEDAMLHLLRELVDFLLANRGIIRVLVIHKKNFLTPKYMSELRSYRIEERASVKTAMLGLSAVQSTILKGYNTFENRDVREFKTKEEALQYLLSD